MYPPTSLAVIDKTSSKSHQNAAGRAIGALRALAVAIAAKKRSKRVVLQTHKTN